MKSNFSIAHEFVEFIPRDMEERTLYIAMEFATASHRCFCGCGAEVVTPLSPTAWQLSYDGENVSLNPSIGSWSLPCQSHYWIRRGKVEWSYAMSKEEIAAVKRRDQEDTLHYHGAVTASDALQRPAAEPLQHKGALARLMAWLSK
ncbi:MAG: DUF6527 family protein [Alphaproteobacteria bacterium]|nr:DUF6527 family protein [Alphaproteobacteria bacterium]